MICKKCGVLNIDETVRCAQCQTPLKRKVTRYMDVSHQEFPGNKIQNGHEDREKRQKKLEQDYDKLTDSEKIELLWNQKTDDLTQSWKYSKFKNKKIIKLIALLLLFAPALFSLFVYLAIHFGSHLDISLPESSPVQPEPFVQTSVESMEETIILDNMMILKPLQDRVQKFYQLQQRLPSISDEKIQQYLSEQMQQKELDQEERQDYKYALPKSRPTITIENGRIESHFLKMINLKNMDPSDQVSIYLIPNIQKSKELIWDCKVVGASVSVEGCERIEMRPD